MAELMTVGFEGEHGLAGWMVELSCCCSRGGHIRVAFAHLNA